MAHDVSFTIPERPLGRSPVEFKIKKDGPTFGTLKISEGSLVWVRTDCEKGHKITWSKLADLIQQHGTSE